MNSLTQQIVGLALASNGAKPEEVREIVEMTEAERYAFARAEEFDGPEYFGPEDGGDEE